MAEGKRPVLIEIGEAEEAPSPASAPSVPEPDEAPPEGRAMQGVLALGTRRRSWLWRLFWSFAAGFVALVLSVRAWEFVTGLLGRSTVLGYLATGLLGGFVLALLAVILREWLGFARLRRIDRLRLRAEGAIADDDLSAARAVGDGLIALYGGREDARWACDRFRDRAGEMTDADAHLELAEMELLAPLDAAARTEIRSAARQVATVTAFVPLALADLLAALAANMRMIRRIARLYGGRAGLLGNWRLARNVMLHLAATGAVAVGDDMLGSLAGGGVLSRVSRRFGEGVINGALTVRVGVAAMEVCRPLPFRAARRPSVTRLVQGALSGLFSRRGGGE